MTSDSNDLGTIVLGTVQFGMPYGLNHGLMEESAVFRVLDRAWEIGIRRIDTARVYGLAEDRLGAWLSARPERDPEIVTKFPPLNEDDPESQLRAAFDLSLTALGRERVHGLLAHDPASLDQPGVVAALDAIQAEGRADRIGASVYDPETARHTLGRVTGPALIQAPANPFDPRVSASGFADEARARGAELVIRSVYLQGIVGLATEDLPDHLTALRPAHRALRSGADAMGLGPHAFAIAFCRHVLGLRDFVFGVVEEAHLDAILDGVAAPPPPEDAARAIRIALEGVPSATIDPRVWPKR